MATLFIASGPAEGKWFPIRKKTIVVGRDQSLLAQVVDEGISRKHLQIYYDPKADRYWALDMQSKNGVFVGGKRITQETPLGDEELIRIGSTLLFFTHADFDDDNNALKYYRLQGQRDKATISLNRDPGETTGA